MPDRIAVKTIMISKSMELTRELDIALRVDHENVVRTLGVCANKELLYIKMELANSDLSKLKEKMKVERLRLSDVRPFATQILGGLSYLHEASITHRDLKPQNILACWKEADGAAPSTSAAITLKLSDFGLSRFVPEESVTATAVGTRSYMAPEVAVAYSSKQDKFRIDYKKADVFSAGVIVYEMLHGARPFTETDLAKGEEVNLPEMCNAEEEERYFMKYVRKMMKWLPKDRCDANCLKNWRPKVK
jgi:serine/threonine protein kinase